MMTTKIEGVHTTINNPYHQAIIKKKHPEPKQITKINVLWKIFNEYFSNQECMPLLAVCKEWKELGLSWVKKNLGQDALKIKSLFVDKTYLNAVDFRSEAYHLAMNKLGDICAKLFDNISTVQSMNMALSSFEAAREGMRPVLEGLNAQELVDLETEWKQKNNNKEVDGVQLLFFFPKHNKQLILNPEKFDAYQCCCDLKASIKPLQRVDRYVMKRYLELFKLIPDNAKAVQLLGGYDKKKQALEELLYELVTWQQLPKAAELVEKTVFQYMETHPENGYDAMQPLLNTVFLKIPRKYKDPKIEKSAETIEALQKFSVWLCGYELINEALSLAGGINDEAEKSKCLASICAILLQNHHHKQALDVAQKMRVSTSKVEIINRICKAEIDLQKKVTPLFEQGIDILDTIKFPKNIPYGELAIKLADYKAFDKAYKMAEKISTPELKNQTFGEISNRKKL